MKRKIFILLLVSVNAFSYGFADGGDMVPGGTNDPTIIVKRIPKNNTPFIVYEQGILYVQTNLLDADADLVITNLETGEEHIITLNYDNDCISIPANLNVGMYGIAVYMDDVCIFEIEIEVK